MRAARGAFVIGVAAVTDQETRNQVDHVIPKPPHPPRITDAERGLTSAVWLLRDLGQRLQHRQAEKSRKTTDGELSRPQGTLATPVTSASLISG